MPECAHTWTVVTHSSLSRNEGFPVRVRASVSAFTSFVVREAKFDRLLGTTRRANRL